MPNARLDAQLSGSRLAQDDAKETADRHNGMPVPGTMKAGGLQCRAQEGNEVRNLSNSALSLETSVSMRSRL